MTDKTSRYPIQTTFSLSSRGISLQAGLPSHIQEEEAIPSLDTRLNLTMDNLDTRPSLSMDNLDIRHSLSMGSLYIPHSLKPCIRSYRIKDTLTQVPPPRP